jgi:hypothetical protein
MGCKCSKEDEEQGEYETSFREDIIDNMKAKSNPYNNMLNSNDLNTISNINENNKENDNNYNRQTPDLNNETEGIHTNTNNNNFPSMQDYDQSIIRKKKKKNLEKESKKNKETELNYIQEVVKLFNLARAKPLVYCKNIDYSITLITTNFEGQLVLGKEETNKIGLKEGITKFNECKRYLLQIDKTCELKIDDDLALEIPEDPSVWLDHEHIKNQIIQKQNDLISGNENLNNSDNNVSGSNYVLNRNETKSSNVFGKKNKKDYTLFGFHFDYGMVDPVLSSVLQLVDDNNCENRRRYNILNPEYRAVGVSCRVVGKKFCSYFFFAG